jgi:hypothetical protein
MSSADSRYAVGSPYGSLTRRSAVYRVHFFVFHPLWGMARRRSGHDAHRRRGFWLTGFPNIPAAYSGGSARDVAGLPG